MRDTRSIVLVTDAEFRRAEDRLTAATRFECRPAPSGELELARAVRDFQVRYVIVGGRQYAGPLYDALPAGGVIARFGVGYDGIDKARATAARLLCTNTPGVLDQSVAEHTMLLIAAASRRLIPALDAMAGDAWNVPAGQDLYGKKLAVIGCGGIGRAVARIAAAGYGMSVVGCTRPDAPAPKAIDHFEHVTNDFAAAVRGADFVSPTCPRGQRRSHSSTAIGSRC